MSTVHSTVSRLFSIGIGNANTDYINSKIKICNQIAVFFLFLGLIYAGFSLLFVPKLTLLPAGGAAISVIAIFLNRYGRHRVSRFLMSIGAVSLTSLYHAFMVPAGGSFIIPLYFGSLGFSIYPWVLVDLREKGLLLGGVSISAFWLCAQNWLNQHLEIVADTSMMQHPVPLAFTYFFAMMVVLTCMYFFQRRNLDMEHERVELLKRLSEDYRSEHLGRQESEKLRGELEAKLLQAQKMEAVGRLAGGIAHDLNNMLVPILGYGELVLSDLPSDTQTHEHVSDMHQAAIRAQELVQQLLAFSRKQTLEVSAVSINDMIKRFHSLIRVSLREDIEVSLSLEEGLPMAKADKRQIEQVVMNLVVNAQDAMPKGGKLIVETNLAVLDDDYCAQHLDCSPGRFVMITVSDTGVGMDRETKEKIFDPFYSTKGELGTGLGLAIAYGIVKQHGGNIWTYSEKGQGTTFRVYLPISEAPLLKKQAQQTIDAVPTTKEKTILVVEDDEHVRKLCEAILERLGYKILAATSGEKALSLVRQFGHEIHLLLTDVIMPDMNGKKLYEAALQVHPLLKVLYMSGYTDNVIAHHGILHEGVNFIPKPFTSQALSVKLREVLFDFEQTETIQKQ